MSISQITLSIKNAFESSYSFCPKCGIDITIFSHEDDCPCARQLQN
jgi:ribosomal protein S27AE